MAIPFNAATSAYTNAASLLDQSKTGVPNLGKTEDAGPNFASVLSSAVSGVIESGNTADQKMMGMVNGDTGIVDVVTAIAETEVALETVVAVRDRVISAYEEIMRMPI